LQAEKAGWVKQQKALEVQLEKQKAAAGAAPGQTRSIAVLIPTLCHNSPPPMTSAPHMYPSFEHIPWGTAAWSCWGQCGVIADAQPPA